MNNWIRVSILFIVFLPLSLIIGQQKTETILKPDISRGQHFAHHVNISKTEFADVNLERARFDTVRLSKSSFNNVDLSNPLFNNINYRKTKLTNIDLSDAEISMAIIGGAKFRFIGLPDSSKEKQRPVFFEEVDLNNSRLLKCDLSGVNVDSCKIEGMKINGILLSDLLKNYKERRQ